jgi:hypothetical protein
LIPIHKVFEFFRLNDDPQVPLGLLYGQEAFVALDYKVSWSEFACCAFYAKLRSFGWPQERMASMCAVVFPSIKKNITDMGGGKVWPMVVLLIDGEFMLMGEDQLYDMQTWEVIDKSQFEVEHALFQTSVCFMVSAIAIIEAERFLKKEPRYARTCPFIKQPNDKGGTA